MFKLLDAIFTYIFIHVHSKLFNGSFELFKVDSASIHDIEIFELLLKELCLIDVMGVLLCNLLL
jgi:hypothetical protein